MVDICVSCGEIGDVRYGSCEWRMHRLPLHAPSFLQRHDISISRAFDWFAGDSCERTNSCFTQSSPVHARTPKMPPLCVCLCVGLRDVVLHSGEMRAAVPFHVRFASSTHSLFSLFSLTLPHRMPYRNCPGDAGRIDSRRLHSLRATPTFAPTEQSKRENVRNENWWRSLCSNFYPFPSFLFIAQYENVCECV